VQHEIAERFVLNKWQSCIVGMLTRNRPKLYPQKIDLTRYKRMVVTGASLTIRCLWQTRCEIGAC
jgi:hypothetical protein